MREGGHISFWDLENPGLDLCWQEESPSLAASYDFQFKNGQRALQLSGSLRRSYQQKSS